MPPVRWKLLVAVAAMCLARVSSSANGGRELSDDGWKPIVGLHREASYSDDITRYRSPSNLEAIKMSTSEPILPPQLPPPKLTSIAGNKHQHGNTKHKVKASSLHNKQQQQQQQQHFRYMSQGHAPQIPIGMITHRSQSKPHKAPVTGKTHPPSYNGKRPMKPARVQVTGHGNREELLAAAPSTAIGNYAYFTQGQAPLKTRLAQPHGHPDFVNRFPPSDDFYQYQRLPVQQYVLPKYPSTNDLHYAFQVQSDEYTRNLVPPLQTHSFHEVDKHRQNVVKSIFKQQQQHQEEQQKVQTATEQAVQVTKPLVAVQTQTQNFIPENILVQVPPPYQHQNYYVSNHNNGDDGQAVTVQVTKEKLNVFHNNIPPNYNPNPAPNLNFNPITQNEFVDFNRYQFAGKPTEAPKLPTYEVTEEKMWQQETPAFHFQYSREPQRTRRPPQAVQSQAETAMHFLPTAMKPERLQPPTSATHSEISTVYSEVAQINRQKAAAAQDQSVFTVQDVSTHYPVLGKPEFKQQYNLQLSPPSSGQEGTLITNEITTINTKEQEQVEATDVPTDAPMLTTIPTRDWQQKRRPGHRRRRPIKPTTSEEPAVFAENYDVQEVETTTTPTRERPLRRRPIRYRTTEATVVVEDRPVRTRQRQRPRPTEEIPSNHKMTTDYYQQLPTRVSYSTYQEQFERTTTERDPDFIKFGKYDDANEEPRIRPKSRRPIRYRTRQEEPEEIQSSETFSEEQKSEQNYKTIEEQTTVEDIRSTKTRRPATTYLMTDQISTTNVIHTPENEVDYSTVNPTRAGQQEIITIEEIHTQIPDETEEATTIMPTTSVTTTTTETTTTTTTTAPTTTKSNRLRRPINFKSSPRPRFSVKEYRQRLNQYTSTTTESSQSTSEVAPTNRNRYAHRSRKPIMRYQQESNKDAIEEETTPEVTRARFVPKVPRYGGSGYEPKAEEEDEEEKTIRTSNSRLRPFGRTRATTEASTTTTQKLSAKPHVFSNLRRPPQLTLRSRIHNRYSSTTEKPITSSELENVENETSEVVESTEAIETQRTVTEQTTHAMRIEPETTTLKTIPPTTVFEEEVDEYETTPEILKNESVLQSQRVSDLTSSAQNDYNTPGMFKSVSSMVRRVPSYFTIATDDPILPIEAFFPNINKERDARRH